jgi:hypothetical protein
MEALIEGIVNGAGLTGVNLAGKLAPLALQLVVVIVTWQIAMAGLRYALGAIDGGECVSTLVEVTLYGAIAALMIESSYRYFIVDVLWGARGQVNAALSEKTWVGFETGVPQTGTVLLEQVTGVIDTLAWRTYRDVWDYAGRVMIDGSLTTRITLAVQAIPFFLQTTVMLVILVIVAQVIKVIVFAAYLSGGIMFGVGAALGPLFIATLPSRTLNDYFWSWFRFMLQALLTLVVAAILVHLLSAGMSSLVSNLLVGNQAAVAVVPEVAREGVIGFANGFVPVNAMAAALLLMLLYGYLMTQLPELVQALMSGQAATVRSAAAGMGRMVANGIRAGVRQAGSRWSESRSEGGRGQPSEAGRRPGAGEQGSGSGVAAQAQFYQQAAMNLAHRGHAPVSVDAALAAVRQTATEHGQFTPTGAIAGTGTAGAEGSVQETARHLMRQMALNQVEEARRAGGDSEKMRGALWQHAHSRLGVRPSEAEASRALARSAAELQLYMPDGRIGGVVASGSRTVDEEARDLVAEARARVSPKVSTTAMSTPPLHPASSTAGAPGPASNRPRPHPDAQV